MVPTIGRQAGTLRLGGRLAVLVAALALLIGVAGSSARTPSASAQCWGCGGGYGNSWYGGLGNSLYGGYGNSWYGGLGTYNYGYGSYGANSLISSIWGYPGGNYNYYGGGYPYSYGSPYGGLYGYGTGAYGYGSLLGYGANSYPYNIYDPLGYGGYGGLGGYGGYSTYAPATIAQPYGVSAYGTSAPTTTTITIGTVPPSYSIAGQYCQDLSGGEVYVPSGASTVGLICE